MVVLSYNDISILWFVLSSGIGSLLCSVGIVVLIGILLV